MSKEQKNKGLKEELELARDFVSLDEEIFMSFIHTWQIIEKAGYAFFGQFGISDAQFNALNILYDHSGSPLHQNKLATLMVVNRASVGSLMDRMQATGLVERRDDPIDRRTNRLYITPNGVALLKRIRTAWHAQQARVLSRFPDQEKKAFLSSIDKFRRCIREVAATLKVKSQKP